MKRLIGGFVAVGVVLSVYGILNNQSKVINNPQIESKSNSSSKEIVFNMVKYNYFISEIDIKQNKYLINNLEKKVTTDQLMEENKCLLGFNGGFYDTNDKALGLLVINKQLIAKERESRLFNGFVWVNSDNKLTISVIKPDLKNVSSASQTGPILIEYGQPKQLVMSQDKQARRVWLVNLDSFEKRTFVGIVYQEKSPLDGPMLADMPNILLEIGQAEGWEKINMAINLDGGSASALKANNFKINEWSNVGNWWCIK